MIYLIGSPVGRLLDQAKSTWNVEEPIFLISQTGWQPAQAAPMANRLHRWSSVGQRVQAKRNELGDSRHDARESLIESIKSARSRFKRG